MAAAVIEKIRQAVETSDEPIRIRREQSRDQMSAIKSLWAMSNEGQRYYRKKDEMREVSSRLVNNYEVGMKDEEREGGEEYTAAATVDEGNKNEESSDEDDERIKPDISKKMHDAVSISSLPQIPRCHGWLQFKQDEIPSKYRNWTYCTDAADLAVENRYALVYDYVPEAPLDLKIAQAQLDFFYQVGIGLMLYRESNWRGGRLVDFGDLVIPVHGRETIGWPLGNATQYFDRPERWRRLAAFEAEKRAKDELAFTLAGSM